MSAMTSRPSRPVARKMVCALLAATLLSAMTNEAAAETYKLRYAIGLGILPVFGVDVEIDSGGDDWSLSLLMAAVPTFSRLYPGRITAAAAGALPKGAVRPESYRHAVTEVERPLSVKLGFDASGTADWVARRLHPEMNTNEAPQAAGLLNGAYDPLSAFMAVMQGARRTKTCPPRVKVFDGYRVLQIAVETVGEQAPPRSAGGGISVGAALACRFTLQSASTGSTRDYSSYLSQGTVWLASVAGDNGLPVPVRVEAGSGATRATMTMLGFSRGK